jgi:AhpD family alkylhydroperoxidase
MEPAGVIAHHRPLLLGYGAIGMAFEKFAHSVEERVKHLAMLRTAQLTGCEWCLDFGSKLAQDSGIPAEDLRELSSFDECQIVELTMAIALENLYGRSNWALGIEREGFSDGMYCVRPEAAVETS